MWGSIVTPIKHTFPQELKFREKRASFVLLPHVKLSFFNLCYKDLTYSVPIRIFLFNVSENILRAFKHLAPTFSFFDNLSAVSFLIFKS